MRWTPLAVAVAPNGASRMKSHHEALPITPKELAETAARCRDAGAAMIHLHVRKADGTHTLDPGTYAEATAAIRKSVGGKLVIQATSEAGGIYGPAEQMQAIREVRPEAVSVALREMIREEAGEPEAAEYFQWLADNGCVPQYILYSAEELEWYRALRGRGLIPDSPHWLLFVLGRYTSGQQSHPADLLPFLGTMPDWPWSMCAFGETEHACAVTSTALGGHVRVGFENNLLLKDGSLAPDNAALVAQVAETAQNLNRPLLDADGLRQLLST